MEFVGWLRRNDQLMDPDRLVERVAKWNRFGVKVHTVGFEQAGSNLRYFLTKLAAHNQGHYSEVP